MTTKDSKNGRKEKSKLQVPFSRKVEWLETQARSIRRTAVIVALVLISLGELLSQSEVQEVFVDIGFLGLLIGSLCLLLSKDSKTGTVATSASKASSATKPASVAKATKASSATKAASVAKTTSATRAAKETSVTGVTKELSRSTWTWTTLALGLFGALIIQSWFVPGTAIAGGDIAPPVGFAWIGKIFETFGWSGSSLGTPVANQTKLPWAFVAWLTHVFGGSGALAQRVWYSLLVAAIMMAAVSLARSLKLSPLAAVVTAMVYFFNPITMSFVGFNPVFQVAMFLVPALAAASISCGTGKMQLQYTLLIFFLAAPFVGYAYLNPPIVLLIALTTGLTPLIVWTRFGRRAAIRTARAVLVGGLVLVGVGAYWIIPSLTSLGTAATQRLSMLSAWAFTEVRSTLANGFWLNVDWGWNYTIYSPYAVDFGRFPLDLIPALVPLTAFVILSVRSLRARLGGGIQRLVGLLAILCLGDILLSNGTNAPGNLLFDPLYALPYGWLLREPGRFLIAVGLGYALLSGLLTEQFDQHLQLPLAFQRFFKQRFTSISASGIVASAVVVVALASSFPLWTGAVITGKNLTQPSSHVPVPQYWSTAAHFLNASSSPQGNLLVLPPDDFYQMPYTWYYGNDGFIANLISRNVVVPSGGGYGNTSHELLNAVKLEAKSLVDHDWLEARRLLNAIGTPIVLVRGDVITTYPGRSIISPRKIDAALMADSEMTPIFNAGSLSLFELKAPYRRAFDSFATIDTTNPRLRDLAVLPNRTALISSAPQQGHEALFDVPSFSKWELHGLFISTSLSVPSQLHVSVETLSNSSLKGLTLTTSTSPNNKNIATETLRQSAGPNVLSDGDFSTGGWGPVGNCDDANPVLKSDVFSANVVPKGGPSRLPALELSASVDSACVTKNLPWTNGPMLLSLSERSLGGSPPRLCVLQQPSNQCASLTPQSGGSGWHDYTTTVYPAKGTTSLTLFLYADATRRGPTSVERYADVSFHHLPFDSPVVLVAMPLAVPTNERLVTVGTGYSTQWVGPRNSTHVVVDGLRNGWLTTARSAEHFKARDLATSKEPEKEGALAAIAFGLAALCWWIFRRWVKSPSHSDRPDSDVS